MTGYIQSTMLDAVFAKEEPPKIVKEPEPETNWIPVSELCHLKPDYVCGFTLRQVTFLLTFGLYNVVRGGFFWMTGPFYPQEARERGIDIATVGFVFAAFHIGVLISCVFYTRYLIPYFGPYRIAVCSAFSTTLCAVLFGCLGYIDNTTSFFAASCAIRVIGGVADAGFYPSAFLIFANEFPEIVSTALTMVDLFFGAGAILGPIACGPLINVIGFPSTYFAVGLFLLMSTLVMISVTPSEPLTLSVKPANPDMIWKRIQDAPKPSVEYPTTYFLHKQVEAALAATGNEYDPVKVMDFLLKYSVLSSIPKSKDSQNPNNSVEIQQSQFMNPVQPRIHQYLTHGIIRGRGVPAPSETSRFQRETPGHANSKRNCPNPNYVKVSLASSEQIKNVNKLTTPQDFELSRVSQPTLEHQVDEAFTNIMSQLTKPSECELELPEPENWQISSDAMQSHAESIGNLGRSLETQKPGFEEKSVVDWPIMSRAELDQIKMRQLIDEESDSFDNAASSEPEFSSLEYMDDGQSSPRTQQTCLSPTTSFESGQSPSTFSSDWWTDEFSNGSFEKLYESEVDSNSFGFIQLLKLPQIYFAILCLLYSAVSLGLVTVTLEAHLKQFRLKPLGVGGVFSVHIGVYTLLYPLWDSIYDKFGKGLSQILIVASGSLLVAIGFLFIGPLDFISQEHNFWLTLLGLCLHGFGIGSAVLNFAPFVKESAIQNGAPNTTSTHALVLSLFTLTFSLGNAFGSAISGWLYDTVGFKEASLGIAGLSLVILTAACLLLLVSSTRFGKTKSESKAEKFRLYYENFAMQQYCSSSTSPTSS